MDGQLKKRGRPRKNNAIMQIAPDGEWVSDHSSVVSAATAVGGFERSIEAAIQKGSLYKRFFWDRRASIPATGSQTNPLADDSG